MTNFYPFLKTVFILSVAFWSIPAFAQTVCDPLGPEEVQFTSEGSGGDDIIASFTPTTIQLNGDEFVIPVRSDGNQVGCPVAVQETTNPGGTFYFQGIRVQRALDCDAPGEFFGTVREEQALFGIDCDAGINRETALQLVDDQGNYEGYFFIIYDPENGGNFFIVTADDGGPFNGTTTNSFGGSTELPPSSTPGEAPDTDVTVPNTPLPSRTAAQSQINETFPVELTSFTGRSTGKDVMLEWTTETEDGNATFEIQRELINGDFQTIGEVAGAGFSSNAVDYTFTDLTAPSGTNYYRLKQIDFSGAFTHSPIISVLVDRGAKDPVVLFPNPASSKVNLIISGEWETPIVSVIDMAGRTIREWSGLSTDVRISLSLQDLAPAIYQVRIADKNQVITRKIVKR